MSAIIKNSLTIRGRELSTLKKGSKVRFVFNDYWLVRLTGDNTEMLLSMQDTILKRPCLEYLVFKTKGKIKYFEYQDVEIIPIVDNPKWFEDYNIQVTLGDEVTNPELHTWLVPTFSGCN